MKHWTIMILAGLLAAGSATAQEAAEAETTQEQEAPTMVLIKTTVGDIKVELHTEKAPKSVANFLSYVDDKFYDGTIFHRVINGFMIQGGGFTKTMDKKKTEPPIENEATNGLTNDRGTLAMARTTNPNSATSQFFINVVDNGGLNRPRPDGHGYAVFAKVIDGMDIVDKIKEVPTGIRDGMRDVPVEPIVIQSITRVETAQAE